MAKTIQNTEFINVDEKFFNLTFNSEQIEGFEFNNENVIIQNQSGTMKHIDNKIVLEFLRCPTTKVYIAKDSNGTKLMAYNAVSNEAIEISHLGNHMIAMNKVLIDAINKKDELKNNPNAQIISHEFIKSINVMLFGNREGEIGIGDYRYLDYLGRPCNVIVGSLDENGRQVKIEAWQPELADDGNVLKLMDKLVDWTNSKEFREMDPYKRVAIFHAKFIHIHPFRDGNGRTGRMILNYMLAISGLPLTDIKGSSKQDYYDANAEAIKNKNYDLLVNLMKKNKVKLSRKLYESLLKYSNDRSNNLEDKLDSNQIM